jgi:antitoxin VapB
MPLNIKDPETDRLARQLAGLTGEKITDAVKTAVRERLDREARNRGKASLEELMAIAHSIASQPVIDPRTPEEIIGYDEHGLPT